MRKNINVGCCSAVVGASYILSSVMTLLATSQWPLTPLFFMLYSYSIRFLALHQMYWKHVENKQRKIFFFKETSRIFKISPWPVHYFLFQHSWFLCNHNSIRILISIITWNVIKAFPQQVNRKCELLQVEVRFTCIVVEEWYKYYLVKGTGKALETSYFYAADSILIDNVQMSLISYLARV